MSPTLAWESPVFRLYLFALLGVLAGSGLVLAGFTWILKRPVSKVWATWRGWLIMAPLVMLAIYLGRVPTILFFSIVALLGLKEFARATGLYRDWCYTGTLYLALLATAGVTLMPSPNHGGPGWYGMYMAMPVFMIAAILLVPILRNLVKGQLQLLSLSIVGYCYFVWMFGHLAFLANAPAHAYAYLLYLIFAVELNDVAAFTCGKLFGRRPLRSAISPRKTWGGSLGALALSMALPWLLGATLPHFGATEKILAGLIVGLGGQLGDLSISVIKRDLGVKDMGALIPGHGGILDRIDSLIYTAPLFLHLVDYSFKHW
jgi:phosphatidate cytidylyltransferase